MSDLSDEDVIQLKISDQELWDYHKEIRHAYDSHCISYEEAVRLANEASPPENIHTKVTLANLRIEHETRRKIRMPWLPAPIAWLIALFKQEKDHPPCEARAEHKERLSEN